MTIAQKRHERVQVHISTSYDTFRPFVVFGHRMSAMQIARIALAVVLLSWAGWELLDYWYAEPRRQEFAKECRDSGKIVITGRQGQMCVAKQIKP